MATGSATATAPGLPADGDGLAGTDPTHAATRPPVDDILLAQVRAFLANRVDVTYYDVTALLRVVNDAAQLLGALVAALDSQP